MSGLEYMRKVMSGELPLAPMVKLLGIEFVQIEEGRAVLAATPLPEHENGIGIAHGGLAAALLDSALGCAVNASMPAGKIFTTLEMKIHYTRPITRDTGRVECTASVVHVGTRSATAEGKIVDAEGRIYAHGTATCMLFRDLTTEGA